jgi:hypothetical protein
MGHEAGLLFQLTEHIELVQGPFPLALHSKDLEEKDPEPGILRLFPDLFLNLLQGPGEVSLIQKLFGIQYVSPLMRLRAWLSLPVSGGDADRERRSYIITILRWIV